MNNITLLVGAGIISLTIFFTFTQEDKVVNHEINQLSNLEYEKLEERLEELQNKMNMLDDQNIEVSDLQKEIKRLKNKMNKNLKASNGTKEIKGTANIHTYLNNKNIEEVSNIDGTLKVYKEKIDIDINEANEIIPPSSPAISSMDTKDGSIYYSVDSQVKSVSFITTSSTNEDTLKIQSSSSNVVESGSPPIPPSLFESNMPSIN